MRYKYSRKKNPDIHFFPHLLSTENCAGGFFFDKELETKRVETLGPLGLPHKQCVLNKSLNEKLNPSDVLESLSALLLSMLG